MCVPLYFTLSKMSLNLEKQINPNISSTASLLLVLIFSFQFIVTLVISRNIFDPTGKGN